ncbi:hypothetical protein BT69DRAFT_1348114 [Atractiella rhizophila]|nr:hypothetical protein BT69DRAFT_1348114 [Atractiella rhizophila]
MSLSSLATFLPTPRSSKEYQLALQRLPDTAYVQDGDAFTSTHQPSGWASAAWIRILIAKARATGVDWNKWIEMCAAWTRSLETGSDEVRFCDEGQADTLCDIFDHMYEKLRTPASILLPLVVTLALRYPPSPTYLTPFHALAARMSLQSRCYTPFLSLLPPQHAPTNISLSLTPSITYLHSLTFHFHAGVIAAVLKRWNDSLALLESVITHPTAPSAPIIQAANQPPPPQPAASVVQINAYKYLLPVSLIARGSPLVITELPRSVGGPVVSALSRDKVCRTVSECCDRMAKGVPDWMGSKDVEVLERENLLGILGIANRELRVRKVKQLAGTYSTLELKEVAAVLGGSEAAEKEVRQMIEDNTLPATIEESDGKTWIVFQDDDSDSGYGGEGEGMALKDVLERKVAGQIELEARLREREREKVSGEPFIQKLLQALNSRGTTTEAFEEEGLGGWGRGDDADWT